MAHIANRLSQLILDELSHGERRILVLIVAVRNALGRAEVIKGDLPAAVLATLRKLVAAKSVTNSDGTYALAPSA